MNEFEKKILHLTSTLNLLGLDTFNTEQAAHYMNRSVSKFKQTAKTLRIPHFVSNGIKTFRKSDVVSAQEKERLTQWQHTENAAKRRISAGTRKIPSQGSSKKNVNLSVM